MKKIIVIVLSVLLLMLAGACGNNTTIEDSAKSKSVLKEQQISAEPDSVQEETMIDEEQAKNLAIECSKTASENNLHKVNTEDVHIYDSNEDAYIFFVGVGSAEGEGWHDVIWVEKATGKAKLIDGVQEELPNMYDVSTGRKL